MRSSFAICAILIFGLSATSWPAIDPTLQAADYYYSHQEYEQALPLWKQILKRDPDNVLALGKVCEMKILLEGRASCREVLNQFLSTRWMFASNDSRKAVREYFDRFQSIFLTDEGQTAFLVGQARFTLKDYAGALNHFSKAESLEQGNVRVLRLKAISEKRLQKYGAFLETLNRLREVQPFDDSLIEDLAEALYYSGDYAQVISLLKGDPEAGHSLRLKTAYALSLAETGKKTEALSLLQAILERHKSAVHPRIWFAKAKILLDSDQQTAEAAQLLRRFVKALEIPHSVEIDGWDPYRSAEMLPPAQKLISEIPRIPVRESHG